MRIAVDFQADGTGETVLLSDVTVTQSSPGEYQSSGTLSPNSPDAADITQWTVLGSRFQTRYESFLNQFANIPAFQTETLDISSADLFLATYSPASYRIDTYDTDPGLTYAEAMGTSPTSTSAAT